MYERPVGPAHRSVTSARPRIITVMIHHVLIETQHLSVQVDGPIEIR